MTATANLLYLVFALGGAAIYLLLPKAERTQSRAGLIVGALAVVAFLAVLAAGKSSPDENTGYFYLFATLAIVAAARVITHPRPVYSALYFVLVVVAVAALLVLQQAEFLAVALIIIYAGAILVTYLFVIMLAQQSEAPACDRFSREPFFCVLAGFVLMAAVAAKTGDLAPPTRISIVKGGAATSPGAPTAAASSNTTAIGEAVMTRYVVALELAGLLLLISMIGAIAMSRKDVPADGPPSTRPPLGQAGRQAEPF